jgi:tetratricopeptide (TPR) repeat protein
MAPRSALAESGDLLDEGIELTRRFQYDEALERFRRALDAPEATASQRATALERIGGIHFSRQELDRAQNVFQRLLDADPEHRLPADQYAPPLVEFFDRVRASHQPRVERSQVTARATADHNARQVIIRAELSAPMPGLEHAVILTRWSPDADFEETLVTAAEEVFQSTVPLPAEPATLEYYIELRAPSGYVLVRVGSAETPNTQQVGASSGNAADLELNPELSPESATVRTPWHRSWWFWTIVGVVVAGGVTGAVVGGLQAQPEPAEGSLGAVTLE